MPLTFEDLQAIAQQLSFIPDDPDTTVRFSNHEDRIRSHNNAVREERENLFPELVESLITQHYLTGVSHPHDYNIPLNLWESTPD